MGELRRGIERNRVSTCVDLGGHCGSIRSSAENGIINPVE